MYAIYILLSPIVDKGAIDDINKSDTAVLWTTDTTALLTHLIRCVMVKVDYQICGRASNVINNIVPVECAVVSFFIERWTN